MNILPLVLSLILVLSFSSVSLLNERRATQIETKSFLGHMETIRQARNAQEEDLFRGWARAIASEDPESAIPLSSLAKTPRTQEELAQYATWCTLRRSCSYSQLNLAPLKECFDQRIQKIALTLIDNLYGHALFYQEAKKKTHKLPEEILALILKTDSEDFISLIEENSPHLETLYKMVKGTNTYDLKIKQGYPPLEDFFCYDKGQKSLFRLHFASPSLLEVIFGEEIPTLIAAKEKEKWLEHTPRPFVSEQELNDLILKENTVENPLTLLAPYIDYTHQPPQRTALYIIDNKTKIRLKREVREWECGD